jgi:undecaprenyl-diphosphatase
MSTWQAILLGLVQGLTEFLPVSSSAHLVAAQALLGANTPGVMLEVSLHFGTLLAILIVFQRALVKVARDGLVGTWLYARGARAEAVAEGAPQFPVALAVLVGSVPVAAAGVLLEEQVKRAFASPGTAGAFLCVTGLLLLATRKAPAPRTDRVGPVRGLAIGLAQAAALLPGISRSGATIAAGYFLGLERGAAARFSFMLAVPALIGAPLWEAYRAASAARAVAAPGTDPLVHAGALAAGTLVAALVGTACLLVLMRVVERGRLHWFAAYCLPVGLLMMAAAWLA